MMWPRALLALSLCLVVAARQRKDYTGYQVLSVTPNTNEHVEFLRTVERNPEMNIWEDGFRLGSVAHVMVPPAHRDALVSALARLGMAYSVYVSDVGRNVQAEQSRLQARFAKSPRGARDIDLNDFNTLAAVLEFVSDLPLRCPAGFECRTYSIGKSINGVDLRVFHISKAGEGRRAQWVDATIHAREWLTTATILKIMDTMVTGYGSDADVTEMLDTYDWYFLPMMNPDGYEHSWDVDRYWRKNLYDGGDQYCYGTDLNRNYDAAWMADGTSDFICIDTYGGVSAASEPETQAVQAEAQRIQGSIVSWTTIHSFSYLWLTPFGASKDWFECYKPDNYEDVLSVAKAAVDAIEEVSGDRWEYGNVCDVLYPASGSTMDYILSQTSIKYAFTPELRGSDFVIDKSQIEPSFQEVWAAIKAQVRRIAEIASRP